MHNLWLFIVFVIENSLSSSHLDIHLRQLSNRIARFVEATKIKIGRYRWQ
jgi:hypothetical protein